MMIPPLPYRFLKVYVPLGFRMFYRKFQIHNASNVPDHGPVIFAINHQNAFMDALVVAVASPRNPWFITRASVFGSAMARFWLGQLQMLPIYRFRDGHANMKKNDEAMENVRQLLKQNHTILIFPEGNHNREWRLRPLQKGIARMAFDLELETAWQSGLHIVPVGLQYEDHLHSYSEVLVNFGKAIATKNYQAAFEQQPAQAINRLMADLATAMKELIVHIDQPEKHDMVQSVIRWQTKRPSDLVARLSSDQQKTAELLAHPDLQIKPPTKNRQQLSCLLKWPLFVLCIWPHIPLLLLTSLIVQKFVKDDHWNSSIKFGSQILLGPIIYLLEIIAVAAFTPGWIPAALFALLLWPTGRFSLAFRAKCLKRSQAASGL